MGCWSYKNVGPRYVTVSNPSNCLASCLSIPSADVDEQVISAYERCDVEVQIIIIIIIIIMTAHCYRCFSRPIELEQRQKVTELKHG